MNYEVLVVKGGCRQKEWYHIKEDNLDLPYIPLPMWQPGHLCLDKFVWNLWNMPTECDLCLGNF